MNDSSAVNRPYNSQVRSDGARATRAAIVQAAQDLFATDGYGATSIDAVASRAGVARATVFNSVGGKPALMRTAYHAAVVGADDPRPAREGALGERARQAKTAEEVLRIYAEVLAEVFEKLGPIHAALVAASADSDELRGMLAELTAQRHEGAANIVDMVLDRGALRHGVSKAQAADILWVFSDPHIWQLLHGSRGWLRADFTRWLSETLRAQIL